jgi:hypothetical protein
MYLRVDGWELLKGLVLLSGMMGRPTLLIGHHYSHLRVLVYLISSSGLAEISKMYF